MPRRIWVLVDLYEASDTDHKVRNPDRLVDSQNHRPFDHVSGGILPGGFGCLDVELGYVFGFGGERRGYPGD